MNIGGSKFLLWLYLPIKTGHHYAEIAESSVTHQQTNNQPIKCLNRLMYTKKIIVRISITVSL